MDTNLFIEGDTGVIRLCMRCKVRGECFNYAIESDSVGIWGGTTDAEREQYRQVQSLLDDEVEVSWSRLPALLQEPLPVPIELRLSLLDGEIVIELESLPPPEEPEELPPLHEFQ